MLPGNKRAVNIRRLPPLTVGKCSYNNHVNKANFVLSFSQYVHFFVYLSNSTCFGRLCAHHQEKQLCLCDTWYLLFCMDDGLVCRVHPAY